MTQTTLEVALKAAARRLRDISSTATLDAELLLAHVLGRQRSFLRAWPQRELPPGTHEAFSALIERRAGGEPVAYLIGRREFWSLNLRVTPDTLIPRPETELLVELALSFIAPGTAARVADLGTGCGAIALAIARERPRCTVIATDVCVQALDVAAANARALAIGNVTFRRGDWVAALEGEQLDLICSNPPYLRSDDPHLRSDSLPYEPMDALVAGPTGLEAIAALIAGARAHLIPGGRLLLEHGFDQHQAVAARLTAAGYGEIQGHADLAGHTRVATGSPHPRPSPGERGGL